ncbi:MAG TPA: hypothetical protein VFG50_05975 [Rhodothermales bacterium]|nr:hypothetical protein [Rhodothermales bacterium]
MRSSDGGGKATFEPPREVNPADVAVPEGYRIEVVATGLTFPTGIAFDDEGRAYVTEAGYSYGEYHGTPRLLRLEPGGGTTVVATGTNPPWNGVAYADGSFFIAGGHDGGGQVLRISRDGQVTVLVDGLPSYGDHHTNGPVVSADGWVYFGQGTTTNSGVVGTDNFDFGWLDDHRDARDIPCEAVTLTGRNFTTPNPLTPDRRDEATTGAYVPFGTPTQAGQVIPGGVPCSGAVMRVRPSGGEPELVAWGLRNPFGLAWSLDGNLYVAENQLDVRGSRPVFGTGDLLWRIEPGTWYGWPDYWAGVRLSDKFEAPGEHAPPALLQTEPGTPPHPAASLGVHSSANGLDFSRSSTFGYQGEAFIAEFGDMAPGAGKVLAPVGFKVVRVDPETGVVEDFAVNRGKLNGPASWQGSDGLERPIAARFDPSGTALYVVDFGVMTIHGDAIRPVPGTGVIWRIRRAEGIQ